jgi:ferric-dicitrate binding protein FerR (iron transport regulator)
VNRTEREAAVRRIMERVPAPVPPDLHTEAVRRGERLLRRRRLAHRVLWLLACAAAVAFAVWAARVHPWVEPPSQTTPPITGW